MICKLSLGKTACDLSYSSPHKKKFLLGFMDLKHGTPNCDAFSDLFNSIGPLELGIVPAPGICDAVENMR